MLSIWNMHNNFIGKVLVCKKGFTLMLLVANLANTKWGKNMKNDWNPGTWVLIWEYSQELSNEYQHEKV